MTQEEQVYQKLAELGIAYERYEHPPVPTVEDAEKYWAGIDATHCKNLFLRNQKGNRHYLVVLLHAKKADLRAVADQIGDGKLSFASPERLLTHLGLAPGSVSPFGLINDRAHAVRVVLDRDLKSAERVSFHPNINTRTLVLARADFDKFLAACGNPVQVAQI
jgi:Ala-tRNA(Pro) deacylase